MSITNYKMLASVFILGSFLAAIAYCQTTTTENLSAETVTSTEKSQTTETTTEIPTTPVPLPATYLENLASQKSELPSWLKPAVEDLRTIRGVYPYFGKLKSPLKIKNDSSTCVFLQLDASISFSQEGKQTKEMSEVKMEELIGYSGNCSDGKQQSQSISLWFYHQGVFTLQFTFLKNVTSNVWFVKSIALSNAQTSKLIGSSKQIEVPFAASQSRSYSCPFWIPIKLYDDKGDIRAYVILEEISMQAYSESNKMGPESLCPYRSDTTPIAVGCTLAIITILIGAAYAIYRSFFMKKVDYDTMED